MGIVYCAHAYEVKPHLKACLYSKQVEILVNETATAPATREIVTMFPALLTELCLSPGANIRGEGSAQTQTAYIRRKDTDKPQHVISSCLQRRQKGEQFHLVEQAYLCHIHHVGRLVGPAGLTEEHQFWRSATVQVRREKIVHFLLELLCTESFQ